MTAMPCHLIALCFFLSSEPQALDILDPCQYHIRAYGYHPGKAVNNIMQKAFRFILISGDGMNVQMAFTGRPVYLSDGRAFIQYIYDL